MLPSLVKTSFSTNKSLISKVFFGGEYQLLKYAQGDLNKNIAYRSFTSSNSYSDHNKSPVWPPRWVPQFGKLPAGLHTAAHWATQAAAKGGRMGASACGWVWTTALGGSADQRALTLHLQAALTHHQTAVVGGVGALSTLALWRAFANVGSLFGASGGLVSEVELLAAAGLVSLGGGLALRQRFWVEASAVERLALRALQRNPGVLEVLGAPLFRKGPSTAVELPGGITFTFRHWRPRVQASSVQVLFSVQGSEREGLVAARASKKKGKYHFCLLAVDCPAQQHGHHRIFLAGDSQAYDQGGLVGAMTPLLRHAAEVAAPELEAARAAEDQRLREAFLVKPLQEGGGMYPWERLSLKVKSFAQHIQLSK